ILMPPHYGNWEWGVLSLPVQLNHEVIGVYKPIRNPLIEGFMAKRRTRLGLQLAPIYITRRTFEQPPATPTLYIMMSDQNPSNRRKAQWVEFLNRPTACLYGADRWARKLDYPVVYMHVARKRRGYYEIHLEEIHRHPAQTEDGAITLAFMKRLEAHLQAAPADWLWSHKRWKYTRESLIAQGIIPAE
ncbi:MAG: lysophospholipid acyltransferase family protein, partial [Phaeodactylibacter sp.]|nr:lysophospholipid acyltransferase family protein [Phaeodactylibacter sp.]